MCIFLKTCCLGSCTGISFIYSTPIKACHIKREKLNKVFKGLAIKGRCSVGWFFGSKLHLVINDKGYIGQTLFEEMFIDGIHLITKPRKNMKNNLMHIHDKLILRKRSLIETVNDELKNICQIEHARHRSIDNFLANLISGLIAYSFLPKNPSTDIENIDNKRIAKAA